MLSDIKCHDCPALRLKTPEQIQKINRWYQIFLLEVLKAKPIKVILLGESYPANRYFYDVDSNYDHAGLMFNLKNEFNLKTNADMIKKFRELRVLVYDCAFCPLHLLDNKTQQRHAATHCLKTYKLEFLMENVIPIITFFPSKRGFLKTELSQISRRVLREFPFNNLNGIRKVIESNYLNDDR